MSGTTQGNQNEKAFASQNTSENPPWRPRCNVLVQQLEGSLPAVMKSGATQ